jgi:hypothetical protein
MRDVNFRLPPDFRPKSQRTASQKHHRGPAAAASFIGFHNRLLSVRARCCARHYCTHCACHRHAPPLLCARHYDLIIVFWWRFPPSSCTPLCSLSLSASPAEEADSPRIPGLKIVEAHCSGQNAERFWKEREVQFRAQAAIDGRRTTKSWSREKMVDFGGCVRGKNRPHFALLERVSCSSEYVGNTGISGKA